VLFEDSYEGMKGFKPRITIQDGVKPDILNPHRVSYSLKDEIEKEF